MRRLLPLLLLLALSLPAIAQREQLVGTWEHQDATDQDLPFLGVAQFRDDGTFTLELTANTGAASLMELEGNPDEPETDPFTEALLQAFPDSIAVAAHIAGVWSAEEQALHLDAQTSEVTLNELPMQEFFTGVARQMARLLADALEIPEAEYPAFEEQVIGQIGAGGEDDFSGQFSPDEADLEGTYELKDGVLYITDEEGERTDWHRITVSAVAATSWGQLKTLKP
ncbi:MAG: hypothetical protein IT369_01700 [Candidatus Latescibacteria bacterium]|nr:hypothetical protein [Candidatus Latescibacterota bacterium]